MAESYFDWLTEQQALPAKPFDPLEELKQLRRKLAARIQTSELPAAGAPAFPPNMPSNMDTQPVAGNKAEAVSLDAALDTVAGMKQTLAACRVSSQHAEPQRNHLLHGGELQAEEDVAERVQSPAIFSSAVSRELNVPQESMLETINAGLMALGIIGVVFGLLSFYRGWESDLSFGTLASASGAAIVAVGLCGRLLASGEHERER